MRQHFSQINNPKDTTMPTQPQPKPQPQPRTPEPREARNQKERTLILNATVIGVDLHSEQITACVITVTDGKCAKPRFFTTPVENAEAAFRKHAQPGDPLLIEATTNAFHLAERLAAIGLNPMVVTSDCVARKERPDRVNDRIDAENLAHAHISGDTVEVWQPSPQHRDMRQLFFARRDAVNNATRAVNRVWGLLNGRGLKTSRTQIKKAKDACELLPGGPAFALLHLGQLMDDYRAALAHRDACDTLIARHAASNPDVQRLLRVLGIHILTAFALVAFIEDANRFAGPKQLVRYLGLNPSVRTSGKYTGSRAISRFGRRDLRMLLIEGAQSAYRHGAHAMHKWARRLTGRKGIRNIGVVALARKMAVCVWHLLKGHPLPDSVAREDASFLRKLAKLASVAGKAHLQTLGFHSPGAFVQHLIGQSDSDREKATNYDFSMKLFPKEEVPA
jgi:transposase